MENLLYERGCRGDAGGILIDIETAIEVRNTRPFDIYEFVDERLCAIILLVQGMIERAKRIRR